MPIMNAERVLLEEIAMPQMRQADIALTYALALDAGEVDWSTVNLAIIDRWSVSGLEHVKAMAWKRHAIRAAGRQEATAWPPQGVETRRRHEPRDAARSAASRPRQHVAA
jgi:hypothetical protein